jgi:hypothetical protein
MTEFATREALARIADVVGAPGAAVRSEIDRSFELPAGLYIATVGSYLGFLGVMAGAFLNPGLAIPMTIFAFFIVAGFGVPTLWVRMNPAHGRQALTWSRFRSRGIQTATGPLDGASAAVQVLILPVLILFWGLCVAVIAAFV